MRTRYDLVPWEAIEAIATVLGQVSDTGKYPDRDWEAGREYSVDWGAMNRHLVAWLKKERIDPESGLSHLWHALTRLSFLVTFDARRMSRYDDLPHSGHAPIPRSYTELIPPLKLKEGGSTPIVYVVAPLSGDIKGNCEKVARRVRKLALEGYFKHGIPWVPHIALRGITFDYDGEDREWGMDVCKAMMWKANEVVIIGPKTTEGMWEEIKIADERGIAMERVPW